MNMDTRYKFANSGWQAFARVNNIFDKEYYSAGMLGETFFDAGGAFQGGDDERSFLVSPGAPRAGWIGLRYEFGGKKTSGTIDAD
jgi:outer membrane receptor protein involved in Fe transport